MPTAAAVAAAAATAKIQAMDAVASNAVLGLSAAAPTLGIPSIAKVLPSVGATPLVPATLQASGIAVPAVTPILNVKNTV